MPPVSLRDVIPVTLRDVTPGLARHLDTLPPVQVERAYDSIMMSQLTLRRKGLASGAKQVTPTGTHQKLLEQLHVATQVALCVGPTDSCPSLLLSPASGVQRHSLCGSMGLLPMEAQVGAPGLGFRV